MTTLHVTGQTLPELFNNTSEQLLAVLIDPAQVGETLREKMVLEASDPPELLQEWINTLLQLTGRQQILFSKIKFQEFTTLSDKPSRLKAEIIGELVDPLRHVFRRAPHSVKCRQVQLTQEESAGWRAECTLETEIL